MSLAQIPNLALQPQQVFSLLLDELLLSADPVQVNWTVSEAELVAVTIDPLSHRANLQAGSSGGLENLHFTARDAAGNEATTTLQIEIYLPPTSFALELPGEISLRAGRTTSLDLESFIRHASFPVDELEWEISSTTGLQAIIRDRMALVAASAGTTEGKLFISASGRGESLTQTILVKVQ